MSMYDFKRTIRVQAVRLDASSSLVLRGMAETGDWLVFDGDAVVVKHSEFLKEFLPSGKDATSYLARNSSPVPNLKDPAPQPPVPVAVPPGPPNPRPGTL